MVIKPAYWMSAFIWFFPFIIYTWGPYPYYATGKVIGLISFVFCLWLLLTIMKWREKKGGSGITTPLLSSEKRVWLFFGLIVISTVFSTDLFYSIIGYWLRFEGILAWFSYISLFIFAYRLIRAEQHERILKGLAIGASLISFYGVLQHYLWDSRIEAFFDNPNFFGAYLVLMSGMVMTLYLSSEGKREQISYLISLALLFAALLFTLTRGSWIGFSVVWIWLTLFVVWPKRQLWRRWAVLMLLFLSIFAVINGLEENKFLMRANSVVEDTSKIAADENSGSAGSGRWYIWQHTLPLVDDYFWVGSGPDTLALVFPTHLQGKVVDKAHNEYLQIAVTLGVPALLVYLSFVWSVVRSGIRAGRELSGSKQIYQYGFLAAIVGYLIQAFFNISVVTVAPFFWILLGMCCRLSVGKD